MGKGVYWLTRISGFVFFGALLPGCNYFQNPDASFGKVLNLNAASVSITSPSSIATSNPIPSTVPSPISSTLSSTWEPTNATTSAWKSGWSAGAGLNGSPPTSSGTVVTTAPAGSINLNPGESVAAVISAAPAGSTFYFNAGTYRMQSVQARSNDTYIGAKGAILNGSRLLTSFQKSGIFWLVTGQTQKNQLNGVCESTHPRCMYPEDLFVDDIPYTQVAALADLTAGNNNWFFDYDAQTIYMADDPTGHVVETSVARSAFSGASATNVTIRNFVVEKYAVPMQMGAIGDQNPGTSWTVHNNEALLNHGLGLKISANSQAIGNHVHHNGEMGMGGSGADILVQSNEIDHNNYYSGVNCGWECGGAKFSSTRYLMVTGNYSHDNYGDGFWTDINNIYVTYEGNWIFNNHSSGIHHEVSYDALIQNNQVEGNGSAVTSWLWSSQIMIVNSQNVEARNNTIVVADWTSGYEGNAIGVLYQDRSKDSEPYGSHNHVTGNLVHDNEVTFLGSEASNKGGAGIVCDLAGFDLLCPIADQSGNTVITNASVFNASQNHFYSNHYYVPANGLAGLFFKNSHAGYSVPQAQAQGQETDSTVTVGE